jgi:hypothetical protein
MTDVSRRDRMLWRALGSRGGRRPWRPRRVQGKGCPQKGPRHDYAGYGTFNLPAGSWSDESSLMLCTAQGLLDGFDTDGSETSSSAGSPRASDPPPRTGLRRGEGDVAGDQQDAARHAGRIGRRAGGEQQWQRFPYAHPSRGLLLCDDGRRRSASPCPPRVGRNTRASQVNDGLRSVLPDRRGPP